jgi:RHS repeat-associated protein
MSYRQRGAIKEDPTIFGLGPNWSCSVRAFVVDLSWEGGLMRLHKGSAGYIDYTNDVPQYLDGSVMSSISGGYQIGLPDGSTNTFTHAFTFGSYTLYFLTSQSDPAGNTTTYTYSTNSTIVQLASISDPDANTTHFYYENTTFTNQITKVVDPFSRTNLLQYDAQGYLTNSIDVAGLTSSFQYDAAHPGWITNMVTPYGPTAFSYGVTIDYTNTDFSTPGTNVNRFVTVTLPNGGHDLYLYRHDCSAVLTNNYFPVPSTLSLSNTLDNVDQNYRNSFHWGPFQYDKLTTSNPTNFTSEDYLLARLRHWLADPSSSNPSFTLSLQREPSQDRSTPGQLTWYDYDGKASGNNYIGTNNLPAFVAVVLPDSTSTRFTRFFLNSFDKPTQTIATYSKLDSSIGLRTNSFYYADNNIDLQQWVGPNGEQILSNYFASGNIIHKPDATYDALNRQTLFTYNANGQVTQIQRPSGLTTTNTYATAGTALNRLTNTTDLEINRNNSYTYYANGLINTHTDERGMTTTSFWDNLQRLTGRSYPDGTAISNVYTKLDVTATKDRLGYWTYFGYNEIRKKIAETNANGVVTRYGYCDCGALFNLTNAWNTSVQQTNGFDYDYQGNRTYVYLPDITTVTWFNALQQVSMTWDSRGYRYFYYNNQGLLTNVSNVYGTEQATVYDNEDRPLYVTDSNGVTLTNSYDSLGRLVSRTHPDGGAEKFGYSARGLTAYTNQIGATNFFAYDEAGRKNFETNANNELLQFYYAPSGDLTNLVDGKGQSTKWAYDGYGRVTNKLDQTGTRILAYAYDPDDRLTNRWSAAKLNTYYSYDCVGNLTNINYRLSADVALQYDELNRLTKMVDAVGTTLYTYTTGGQLLTEDGPFASDTVTNGYVNRQRVSLGLQQPTGAWTNAFGYDAAARLTNVTSQAGSFSYHYSAGGTVLPGTLIRRIALPNTSLITNFYDGEARLTGTFLQTSGGSTLDSATYGYNVANQRTTFTNAAGTYVQYSYDNIGQLKVADSSVNTEDRGYNYDAAWNLHYRTNNGTLGTFTVDTKNELTNAPSPANALTYDSNGNIAGAQSGHNAYAYDDENRLIEWAHYQNSPSSPTGGDTITEFAYDGLGRLRQRAEYVYPNPPQFLPSPGNTNWQLVTATAYIYDGLRVIQERDSNNVPVVSYTRGTDLSGSLEGAGGIGGLLARSSGYSSGNWTSHAYYHADGNGNITYLETSSQTLAASYRYDPFGNITASSGTLAAANVYRFSSKEYMTNSGLYYYLMRFYDPNLQRWINRDPIQEAGGINLYTFVRNNVITAIDPFGLDDPYAGGVPGNGWQGGGPVCLVPSSTGPALPPPQFTLLSGTLTNTTVTNAPPPVFINTNPYYFNLGYGDYLRFYTNFPQKLTGTTNAAPH